jgi:hypothetical protein
MFTVFKVHAKLDLWRQSHAQSGAGRRNTVNKQKREHLLLVVMVDEDHVKRVQELCLAPPLSEHVKHHKNVVLDEHPPILQATDPRLRMLEAQTRAAALRHLLQEAQEKQSNVSFTDRDKNPVHRDDPAWLENCTLQERANKRSRRKLEGKIRQVRKLNQEVDQPEQTGCCKPARDDLLKKFCPTCNERRTTRLKRRTSPFAESLEKSQTSLSAHSLDYYHFVHQDTLLHDGRGAFHWNPNVPPFSNLFRGQEGVASLLEAPVLRSLRRRPPAEGEGSVGWM